MLSHTYSVKMPSSKGTRIVMADSDFVRLTNICHLNLKFVTFSRFKVVSLDKNGNNKFNCYFSLSDTEGIYVDFMREQKQNQTLFSKTTSSDFLYSPFLVFP